MTKFDIACRSFTIDMRTVSEWKHSYLGAAYSTRLREALKHARAACDRLEAALDEDDKEAA